MKRIFLLLILLIGIKSASAIEAQYDERIELMGILCNIAGFEEYNMNLGGQYCEDVDNYFSQYKNHPSVSMMQRLHEDYGIAYEAPMAFALHLNKHDDSFSLANDTIIPEVSWTDIDRKAVADTLSMFYRDTNFSKFFNDHIPFYESVCRIYNQNIASKINEDWYAEFYGTQSADKHNIIIGFINGGSNYGLDRNLPDSHREVYAVIGYALDGDRSYYETQPQLFLNTLIHEFNHSFVNPLVDQNIDIMKSPMERVLNLSRQIMALQAYPTWETVAYESIVRAAVICYFQGNGSNDDVREAVLDETSVGFAWMPLLVARMQEYRKNRDKYPTFNDFFPQLALAFAEYADTQDAYIDSLMK